MRKKNSTLQILYKNKFHFAWQSHFLACLLSYFNRIGEICLSIPKFIKNKLWLFCYPNQNFFPKKSNRRCQNSCKLACLFSGYLGQLLPSISTVKRALPPFRVQDFSDTWERMSSAKGRSSASDRGVSWYWICYGTKHKLNFHLIFEKEAS